jgi:hypothetical protein
LAAIPAASAKIYFKEQFNDEASFREIFRPTDRHLTTMATTTTTA